VPLLEEAPEKIINEVKEKSISVDRKIELDLMPEIIEQSVEESIKDSFFSNPNRSIDNLFIETRPKLDTVANMDHWAQIKQREP